MKHFIKSALAVLLAICLCLVAFVACNEVEEDDDEVVTRKPKKTTENTTEVETENKTEDTTENITEVETENKTEDTTEEKTEELTSESDVPRMESNGLTYVVNDDGTSCTISGIGECTDTVVGIPAKIDEYTVTAIGDNAFEDCTHITEIIIYDNVKSIGKRAFKGCSGISEITIPNSVEKVGSQAFYKCSGLDTIYWNADYIGDYFDSVSPLADAPAKNVVFGCARVQAYILRNSSNVENVVFLNNVSVIDHNAFADCANLKSIKLDSVVRIEDYAFSGCTSLSDVEMSQKLTKIGSYAFRKCTSLKSINLPNSLTEVENNAFEYCSSMESIVIPSSMEVIPYGMFTGCYALKTVTIPDTITEIEGFAFNDCKKLEGVVIPDSVIVIGRSAFGCCQNPIYCEAEEKPAGWEYDWNSTIGNEAPVVWGESHICVDNDNDRYCDMLCGRFFYSEGLKYSYNKTDKTYTLTGIGTCKDSDIYIPDYIDGCAVVAIADFALCYLTSFKSITITNTVTKIGTEALASCESLKTITISNSVTNIGDGAFYGCHQLNLINYTGTQAEWNKIRKGTNWDTRTDNYQLIFESESVK